MIVKLYQLVNAKPILDKLLAIEMSLKQAFKLTQITKIVYEHFKTFDDLRISLIKKLGIINEETNSYNIPEENKEEFLKELNEVLETEISIEFTPLDINDFPENIKISTFEFNTVSIFFEH